MAASHANCTHPRTPAGRAACRKSGGPGATPSTGGVHTTGPSGEPVWIRDTKGRPGSARERVTPEPRRFVTTHADGCTQPDQEHSNGRCPMYEVRPPRKLASKGLKRPGTQLRTDADLPDVPHAFIAGIEAAWKQGWIVRVGDRFNDTERRIELFGTHGVVSLVWKDSNPHGLNGVFFRPASSSIISRVQSVNQALRMAGGE